MPSMRDIKRRIKSVANTQQITKAMNLVAVSKLQKAKARITQTRPYFEGTKRVIASVIANSQGVSHRFLQSREVKKSLLIIINGDRGLCGGYNANISKEAYILIRDSETPFQIVAIGNKAREFFKRRRADVIETFLGFSESPHYEDAAEVGRLAVKMFEDGDADEVFLAYTEFKSILSHQPVITKVLPLNPADFPKPEGALSSLMLFEPNEEAVLNEVIPKYVNTLIYGALVESSACEQGARMTAMDSATDNAQEMITDLTLMYNRARQTAITQEITEIVGGASALS